MTPANQWQLLLLLRGANFGAALARGVAVEMTGAHASVSTWSHREITAWSPAFGEQNVSVSVGGGTSSNDDIGTDDTEPQHAIDSNSLYRFNLNGQSPK